MKNSIIDLVLYIVCTTILVLFVCFNGYGQGGTVTSVIGKSPTRWTLVPQYDTAKVIMLICDTSKNQLYIYSKFAHLQYGYEVYKTEWRETQKITQDDGGISIIPAHNQRNLFSRLDTNKKPLSKNIIVWQTIPIK